MARLKSAYREREAPAESIITPALESPDEAERPSDQSFELEPVSPGADATKPADTPTAETVRADEARNSLRKQIEDLRRSEQQAREAAHQASRHPSREQLLELWEQQGASATEIAFLRNNPELIDHPQVTALAAHEAAQMHPHGSEEHRQATRRIFHERMNEHTMADTQTPAFFSPPPSRLPAERNMGSIVSAPVSREVPGTAGSCSEPSPSRVRLTAAEVEIARASGISAKQYALNKLRMLRERSNGERQ